MRTRRQISGFWVAIGMCVAASTALGGWWLRQAQAVRRLRVRVEGERRTLRGLEAEVRAGDGKDAELPSETERLQRLQRALLDALVRNEAMRAAPTPRPQGPTEACGMLAAMAQRLRTRAAAHGVALADGESFGFAAYAQAGPAATQLSAVHRQCLAVEEAVGLLIDAGPAAIVAVRCEALPGEPGADGLGGGTIMAADAADTFRLASGRDWRVEGVVESAAVQLQFVGHTVVLRRFLNRVTASAPLLAVRGVACESTENVPRHGRDASASFGLQPEPLKFTVRLERACLTEAARIARSSEAKPDVSLDTKPTMAEPWPPSDPVRVKASHADLFTSPVVHEQASGVLRVSRLSEGAEPVAPEAEPSEPAVEVRPRPFRIQLLGYVGTGGDGLGTFVDVESGQTFLAGSGEIVPAAAIRVHKIRRSLRAGDGLPAWVTEAEVEDLAAGLVMTLTDAGPNRLGVDDT